MSHPTPPTNGEAGEVESDRIILAGSEAEVKAAVESLQPNEKGVLVYHGTETVHFREGAVSVADLRKSGGRELELLTCSSWSLSGEFSTGKIDVGHSVETIVKFVKRAEADGVCGRLREEGMVQVPRRLGKAAEERACGREVGMRRWW